MKKIRVLITTCLALVLTKAMTHIRNILCCASFMAKMETQIRGWTGHKEVVRWV